MRDLRWLALVPSALCFTRAIGIAAQQGVPITVQYLAVANAADGRLNAFAIGQNNFGYQLQQTAPNSGWGPWQQFSSIAMQQVVLGRNKDGRLEAFALSPSGAVSHRSLNATGNMWSAWAPLGGQQLRQLVAASNADGRLELFALGGNNAVYHNWQSTPGGTWGEWVPLAGTDLQQIAVAPSGNGRLLLAALGGDGAVYQIAQVVPNGDWGEWSSLGGTGITQIALGINADGRLEVFALGADRALYHNWQLAADGDWNGWDSLQGSDLRSFSVGGTADGRLVVIALGADGALYPRAQVAPNGGWGAWETLRGKDLRQLTLGRNADGRLEVFALGADGAVYHIWQLAPNGGWGDWSNLSQPTRLGSAALDLDRPGFELGYTSRLKVFNLYWADDWDSRKGHQRAPGNPGSGFQVEDIDAATRALAESDYFDKSRQYGVPGVEWDDSRTTDHVANPCARIPTSPLTSLNIMIFVACEEASPTSHVRPVTGVPSPTCTACGFSPSGCFTNLACILTPNPTGNTIFNIFLPKGTVVEDAGSRSCDVGSYHAYHFQIPSQPVAHVPLLGDGRPIYYTVIPTQCFSSIANMMKSVSHELVEAATDPLPMAHWIDYSSANPTLKAPDLTKTPGLLREGEVADICQREPLPDGSGRGANSLAARELIYRLPSGAAATMMVVPYWSNEDHACVNSGQ